MYKDKKGVSVYTTNRLLFLLLFYVSLLKAVDIPEGPYIDPKTMKHWAEKFGKATGKGLAETVTRFLQPTGKKSEPAEAAEKQKDYIQDIFEGKKVVIPRREINTVRVVKLNKAPFHTTVLMAAVAGGHPDLVDYILEHNADPNIQNNDGLTALHLAARSGKKDITQTLLAYNADPNSADKHGMTPLMYAIIKNKNQDHNNVIQRLLHYGADPNRINKRGTTPLMLAVLNNDYDVTKLLLKHNADLSIKDPRGRTAFDLAHDEKIKNLLLMHQYYSDPLIDELIQEEEFFPVFGSPINEG
jgi:hypothetical protein